MLSHIFVILFAFTFCAVGHAEILYCDNSDKEPLTGIINSDVIVDGRNCTMREATINGDVTVINKGVLRIYVNTMLQKRLTAGVGADVEVYESTVNGRIRAERSERLGLTRSRINGRVSADGVISVRVTTSTFEKDVILKNVEASEIDYASSFRGSITATVDSGSEHRYSSLMISYGTVISGKLSVSGTLGNPFSFVTILGATMENEVTLTDVGGMQIERGAQLKKGLNTNRIGNTFIQGQTSTVVIDGPIADVDGTGSFIANGVKFTSSVTVTNRDGNVYIEDLGNGQVEVNGEIVVQGGKGYVFLRGISSFVQKFTCKNQVGKVTVANIAQSNSMLFDACEHVYIEDTTVNDRLSILDCGRVDILGSTCRNVIEIKNSDFEVALTDNLSNNLVDLENNSDKVTLKDNAFNRIKCTDNPNIDASNNRANQVIGNCGFN